MMSFLLHSPAFKRGKMIPEKYTSEGQNISPPLEWEDVPSKTKSLALIADDPDTASGNRVHWVLFNLPRPTKKLPENVPPKKVFPQGTKQGVNDFQQTGYHGPCPDKGTHRYYFKLYALDTELDMDAGISKPTLEKAMEGHILAVGTLIGIYEHHAQ